ncbi:hypothetical protein ACFSQT_13520 [Mesorhizobium calcicola]|uniref:Uncharacterized protein n=1 Tax=Mesorhizobium calcicola TaxID=1300310 RepID=A0ABW4WFB2_9HYPH
MFAAMAGANGYAKPQAASPIYGVTIPEGYRQWELIAPAEEAEPLNELAGVLGLSISTGFPQEDGRRFSPGTL